MAKIVGGAIVLLGLLSGNLVFGQSLQDRVNTFAQAIVDIPQDVWRMKNINDALDKFLDEEKKVLYAQQVIKIPNNTYDVSFPGWINFYKDQKTLLAYAAWMGDFSVVKKLSDFADKAELKALLRKNDGDKNFFFSLIDGGIYKMDKSHNKIDLYGAIADILIALGTHAPEALLSTTTKGKTILHALAEQVGNSFMHAENIKNLIKAFLDFAQEHKGSNFSAYLAQQYNGQTALEIMQKRSMFTAIEAMKPYYQKAGLVGQDVVPEASALCLLRLRLLALAYRVEHALSV